MKQASRFLRRTICSVYRCRASDSERAAHSVHHLDPHRRCGDDHRRPQGAGRASSDGAVYNCMRIAGGDVCSPPCRGSNASSFCANSRSICIGSACGARCAPIRWEPGGRSAPFAARLHVAGGSALGARPRRSRANRASPPCRPRSASLTPLDPYIFEDARHRGRRARARFPTVRRCSRLGPVASLPEKTWPAQRFQSLVRLLTASGGCCAGWRVAAFGGPGDEAIAAEVIARRRSNLPDRPWWAKRTF